MSKLLHHLSKAKIQPVPLGFWLIVFATELEQKGVCELLGEWKQQVQLSSIVTGIGSINSAIGLVQVLEKVRPLGVLNLGIGGASTATGLELGSAAIAKEEWFADVGVRTEHGDFGLEELGFPLNPNQPKPWNRVLVDDEKSAAFARVLSLPRLPFISVNQCSGSLEIARKREEQFSPFVENMEGATLGMVCARYGIPFVELRAISNQLGERDKSRWQFQPCFQTLAQAVQRLAKEGLITLNSAVDGSKTNE